MQQFARKKIYVIGGRRKYSTFYLNGLVMKCDKRKTENVGQIILDMQEKLKGRQIDQVVHHELLFNLIRHNFSYKFVEYLKLRT